MHTSTPHRLLAVMTEHFQDFFTFTLDATGHLTGVSAAILQLTGYAAEDVIGQHFLHYIAPDPSHQERAKRIFAEALATGFARSETWIVRNDGTRFWAEVVASAERAGDGPISSFTILGRNLDAQTDAEAKLARVLTERCASVVCHHLNNAFGPILLQSDLLAQKHPTLAGIRELNKLVHTAVERQRLVSSTLMRVARMQVLQLRPHRLAGLVETALDRLRGSMAPTITLSVEVDASLWIECDPESFIDALLHVLQNAGEALGSKYGQLTIAARTSMHGEAHPWIHLHVDDTGRGLPTGFETRAFDAGITTKTIGLGLGLTVTQMILADHHGYASLAKRPEGGTRCTLSIPQCDAIDVHEEAPSLGELPTSVLIVEDDDLIASTFIETLEALDVTNVRHVETLAQARIAIQEARPAIVILDLNLPDGHGSTLYPTLAAAEPRIPVLFVTGGIDTEELSELVAHPGVELLKKPFTLGDLEATLRSLTPARP